MPSDNPGGKKPLMSPQVLHFPVLGRFTRASKKFLSSVKTGTLDKDDKCIKRQLLMEKRNRVQWLYKSQFSILRRVCDLEIDHYVYLKKNHKFTLVQDANLLRGPSALQKSIAGH